MRALFIFILGASLSANVVLILPRLLEYSMPGAWVASSQPALRGVAPGTIEDEVIQTMRINRTLNALAFLSMFSLAGPAISQEASVSTDLRMNATTEAVFHDNMKNGAAAAANGLALLSGTRSASLSLSEQNAVSNQQAMNQLQAKMVAQTTITSATEGSKAVETIQQAGDAANMATILAMLGTMLNSTANTGGQ